MKTQKERLLLLDNALTEGKTICTSEGVLCSFPPTLKQRFDVDGVGVIVCLKGNFSLMLNQNEFQAHAGETLFIPEYSTIHILEESEQLEVSILLYKVTPIRGIIGNLAVSMHLYSRLVPNPRYVWQTGEEDDVMRYMEQINSTLRPETNSFDTYEQKLLLLALTYRLCSIYNRDLINRLDSMGHRNETFMQLINLIEANYMKERGVKFYADKLFLSPKYLSALSKSICGYSVQEMVFKAITRQCIAMLKNTQLTVQEIADRFNFPNASAFGTFFRKQTGVSPRQYRKNLHI